MPTTMSTMASGSSDMRAHLLLAGVGIAGVGLVGLMGRRLTRSHDGKPQRDEIATARVQSVVRLVGAGLGITAGTAILVFKNANGVSRSVVHMGWKGAILATVCVCAPLLGAVVLPIEQRLAKLACAALFHAVDGVLLSSLGFVGAGILYPAALITAGTATGLGALAMCAPPRLYMTLAAPLSAGLAALALGNLFAAFAGSAGVAAALWDFRVYGGILVTSGYIVFDAQKLVADAMAKDLGEFDDVVAALNLSLDVVNLFVYIVELLAGSSRKGDDDDEA